jgi:hypothetical protein
MDHHGRRPLTLPRQAVGYSAPERTQKKTALSTFRIPVVHLVMKWYSIEAASIQSRTSEDTFSLHFSSRFGRTTTRHLGPSFEIENGEIAGIGRTWQDPEHSERASRRPIRYRAGSAAETEPEASAPGSALAIPRSVPDIRGQSAIVSSSGPFREQIVN